MDHSGSVADLKDLTNAKVAVGVDDADFVSGKQPLPKPKNLLMRAASSLMKIAPVNVAFPLKDGDTIGGLTVMAVPGHTPGSITLQDKARRALFVGDTLRFEGGKVTAAPRQYTWDADKEKDSIRKIAALDFDVMLPGHGEVLVGNAAGRVREFSGR
jgi:glyoxylase-like metal-dependent hydrolase (beta-lactamase superfamily II)